MDWVLKLSYITKLYFRQEDLLGPREMTDTMSVVLPSEIIVDRFLPTMRVMIATRLADQSFTQEEIATHLGVTQAAVSTYVTGEAPVEQRFHEDDRMRETADRIANGIATGELDGYGMVDELLQLIREFEDRGPICEIHEAEMPELAGLGCDLCVRGRDVAIQRERETLGSVRRGARRLATTDGVANYIPNVGTNVGTALPEATDRTDVAAIPGRIYTVGDRVEVPANPEFGASQHVATVILAAMAVDPSVRGALNISTDNGILSAAREIVGEPIAFDPSYDDRGARLQELFRDHEVPAVVYHEGAFGIEPITYVLGHTAVEAAELTERLVERAEGGNSSTLA